MLHYLAWWHYDVFQRLRLVAAVDRLDNQRVTDALDMIEGARRPNGRVSGSRWSSSKQPAAVDWGRGNR